MERDECVAHKDTNSQKTKKGRETDRERVHHKQMDNYMGRRR